MSKSQFKLLQRKDFNTLLPYVTFRSTFVLSELFSSTIKPVLLLSRCQVKILDNSLAKIPLSTIEPLLFKWSLPLCKSCVLILLVLSITWMFFSLHTSLTCVFTSWPFWLNFLLSVLRMMFDMLTSQLSPSIEHARLTIEVAMSCEVLSRINSLFLLEGLYDLRLSQRQFHIILHAICCCAWKMLDKNLTVALNFFDISRSFKCFSILSLNITIDFLLFEMMSPLLIDELSSLLSAFSLVDALSTFCLHSFFSLYYFF